MAKSYKSLQMQDVGDMQNTVTPITSFSDKRKSSKTKHKKGKTKQNRNDKKKSSKHSIKGSDIKSSLDMTLEEKISFNSIISFSPIDIPQISTIEHKVCGLLGLICSMLIISCLIYGELSTWNHISYTQYPNNNTIIYNTSFIVTCSWNKLKYSQTYPIETRKTEIFSNLCSNNIPYSCSFDHTGKCWFVLLFLTMIILILSSIILMYPQICKFSDKYNYKIFKIFKLKSVKYLFCFCGLLSFISFIPITWILSFENDLCGNTKYNENKYNGLIIENTDKPKWTLYLAPIIAVILWLSACFIAQIKIKPKISDT